MLMIITGSLSPLENTYSLQLQQSRVDWMQRMTARVKRVFEAGESRNSTLHVMLYPLITVWSFGKGNHERKEASGEQWLSPWSIDPITHTRSQFSASTLNLLCGSLTWPKENVDNYCLAKKPIFGSDLASLSLSGLCVPVIQSVCIK